MDKKTLLVIIFTLIFMAILIYIVVLLVSGSTPYVDTFLDKLNRVVTNFFNRAFSG